MNRTAKDAAAFQVICSPGMTRFRNGASAPWIFVVLLAAPCAARAEPPHFPQAFVSSADGEVWVRMAAGAAPTRVSHDPRYKSAPQVSPDGAMFLYDARCCRKRADESVVGHWNEIVVMAWPDRIVWRTIDLLLPNKAAGRRHCAAIDAVAWIDNERIGVICPLSPAAEAYSVLSLAQRQPVALYEGLSFTWSPDRLHVAHIAPYPQFVAPWAQSECMMIDGRNVSRPDCDWGSHGKGAPGVDEPNIEGISAITWAPDSRHVAFLDTMRDWRFEDGPSDPEGRNGAFVAARSYLAIAAVEGGFAQGWRVPEGCAGQLRWMSASRVTVRCDASGRMFDPPTGRPENLP